MCTVSLVTVAEATGRELSHLASFVSFQRNKLCGATRLSNGSHVVIQLLAIGEDGMEEVKMLQRLHRDPISTEYSNRCVPLLDMVTYEPASMIFGVFPLLFTGYQAPRPGYLGEGLKTCYQILEVSFNSCGRPCTSD